MMISNVTVTIVSFVTKTPLLKNTDAPHNKFTETSTLGNKSLNHSMVGALESLFYSQTVMNVNTLTDWEPIC
jgi:hypothetical protein